MTPAATTSSASSAGVFSPWSGIALATAGAIAFSGKAILAKLMYRHGVDAVQVLFWRMALALPLFLALAWWAGRGKPALERRDWAVVVGLGFCGYYLASMLDFMGLQYITASLERLILYLNPTLVLLLSMAMLGRRVGARQLAAMALSYAGVLIVFGQELNFEGAHVALGSALVFASAVSYAVYLVACGEEVRRLGALRLTGLATSVASLFAIAQLFVLRDASAGSWSARNSIASAPRGGGAAIKPSGSSVSTAIASNSSMPAARHDGSSSMSSGASTPIARCFESGWRAPISVSKTASQCARSSSRGAAGRIRQLPQ